MKFAELKNMVWDMSAERIHPVAYSDYLSHKTREDKNFREELLVIYAVAKHYNISDDVVVNIGGEQDNYDARIDGKLIEITQALPDDDYKIRRAIANTSVTPSQFWSHANDRFQFPVMIISAIEKKHKKRYGDTRILVVAFDGDHSLEDDTIIRKWIATIRQKTRKGDFEHILLVERDRRKVFRLF